MRSAAALLVGTHDFTQFSNDSDERSRRSPVKTLLRLDVIEAENGLRLEVGERRGDGCCITVRIIGVLTWPPQKRRWLLRPTATSFRALQQRATCVTVRPDLRATAQVQGTGFLYKQVRHMTGALMAVGEGRMTLADVAELLRVMGWCTGVGWRLGGVHGRGAGVGFGRRQPTASAAMCAHVRACVWAPPVSKLKRAAASVAAVDRKQRAAG